MTRTSGPTLKSVPLKYHHSPTAIALAEWHITESKRTPKGAARSPPRELTDVPDVVVLGPGTTTPSDIPYTTLDFPFTREAYSPITDRDAITARQIPGFLVFTGRRSRSFESFKPDTQTNRLRDVGYITLQMNGEYTVPDAIAGPTTYKDPLRGAIVGPATYKNATVGVYTAEHDSALGELGTYRLETYEDVDVRVNRPQGSWVITVCTPDGDRDGKKTIGKSGENINFCATVTRGEKGHCTTDGTLIYQYGPGWYGLQAVGKKEEATSRIREGDKAPYSQEKVGEKGQADESSGTRESEKGVASFSEKDRGWRGGCGESDNRSTNTPSRSVWRRLFGGGRPSERRLQSTKRQ